MTTADAKIGAANSWKAARLKQKTLQERQEINARVTSEQRLAIVNERHLYSEGDQLPKIQLKFAEGSDTHALLSSLAFYKGSPVGAEIPDGSDDVEFRKTSKGLTSWRIDEFYKSKEIVAVLIAVVDCVFAADDEEMMGKIRERLIARRSVNDPVAKAAARFFDDLSKFREASRSLRSAAKKAALLDEIKQLSEDDRRSIFSDLQVQAAGPVALGNVTPNLKAA